MNQQLETTEVVEVKQNTGGEAVAVTVDSEPSVATLLQHAIDKGIDPDGLNKLADLYERMDARRAQKEFASALLAFQNACPVISKTADGHHGKYAPLDYIAATIRPHLQHHGLSWTSDSKIGDGEITVTTIIRHTEGHEERNTFTAPIDKTAKMNDMQKVASASSYARRYGLTHALGITTGGEDDDGNAGGTEFITTQNVADLEIMLEGSGADRARFLKFMGVDQLAHMPRKDFKKAVTALKQKKAGAK